MTRTRNDVALEAAGLLLGNLAVKLPAAIATLKRELDIVDGYPSTTLGDGMSRSTADLTKASGVIYGGKVCGSTADDYNACTDPVLKAVIVEYWAACDDRFRAACAEIDAAETADDIEKVAF